MSWLDTSNKTLSLILKIVLLVGLICGVAWILLSVVGNIWTNDGTADYPSVDKARYKLTIRATGEMLFTNDCDLPTNGVYVMNGYYELSDGEYRWHDISQTLDEKYFGPIRLEKR